MDCFKGLEQLYKLKTQFICQSLSLSLFLSASLSLSSILLESKPSKNFFLKNQLHIKYIYHQIVPQERLCQVTFQPADLRETTFHLPAL